MLVVVVVVVVDGGMNDVACNLRLLGPKNDVAAQSNEIITCTIANSKQSAIDNDALLR